ncbi:pirin family protein [Luteimonas sp. RD2P54]|uniref:Pirin family protein n=1 Tax=Luteimonas endophytica TaxID=3042023 RepID=A0ABT6JEE3_9GAMM|nr:pirin family protein [Luteimonas endophytica]MDH5824930.1 pirin family protein [Luteimonas endophytica]
MHTLRRSADRGHVAAGWLDSRHSFSFGHYHDPEWMGWGALRVINEDRVQPGGGFAPHRHANMEILSYVLSGALAHRDSGGGEGVLRPGEVQWMSAGHGIEHSEYNGSDAEPVHFLQIWIQPDRLNAEPAYQQRAFDPAARRGRWAVLASPEGEDGSIAIRQQAWLRGAQLGAGESLTWAMDPARRYWLHLASGQVNVARQRLAAGDAIGWAGEAGELHIAGVEGDDAPADLLLFDLPA